MPRLLPPPTGLAALLLLGALLLPAGLPRAAADDGDPVDRDREVVYFNLISLEPFPRSAPAGSEVRIKFRLKGGLRAPVLVVVYPVGPSAYVLPDTQAGYDYEIPFRLDRLGGTHRLSIIGRGPTGDRLAAQFLIRALSKEGNEIDRDVAIPPEDTVYPDLDPGEHPLRLERILFHRMNAFRAKQGMKPVPWHEGVARAAREQIEAVAKHYEETLDPRTGRGILPHRVPRANPDGSDGPTIADRVRMNLAWPLVLPYVPREDPERGRGKPNYVGESLGSPAPSLDAKFEQYFLRKSDLRAPMLSPWITHAAGAATWRWYGWKAPEDGARPAMGEPGPPPAGRKREVIAALVFVQVNDPAAAASWERDRREVRRTLAAASKPADRADALRLLGQTDLPESRALLADAAQSRDPVVLAGALDGLWLCAPEEAAARTEPLRLAILGALGDGEEARALEAMRTLEAIRYDAESRRAGRTALRTVADRARQVLEEAGKAGAGGDLARARELLRAAKDRFAGFPEGAEAAEALRNLPGEDPPAPPK